MTVTHVMAEDDARGVFPEEMDMGHPDPRTYTSQPTVKWIIVAEPFVVDGAGLPDVEIVSYNRIVDGYGWAKTVHGVVTIGATVPIHGECPDYKPAHHICHGWAGSDDPPVWFLHLAEADDEGRTEIQITDEFGGQDVAAGSWAHPVTVVS